MEKTHYISREDYINVKAAWKLRHSGESAVGMVIYNVLRSKPAASGFVPKTKNVQGNDEWYAFNQAMFLAERFCSPDHVMVEDPSAPPNRITGKPGKKWVYVIEPALKRFKERFGIDRPEGLLDALKASEK